MNMKLIIKLYIYNLFILLMDIINKINSIQNELSTKNNELSILQKLKSKYDINILNTFYKYYNNISNIDNKKTFEYFIFFCLSNLPKIKSIPIHNNITNNNIQIVYIEFRQFPHLEFIIRNNILRLPSFQHTIICGNHNFQLIQNFNLPIQIIKKNINNISKPEYSLLLANPSFWKQFQAPYILICQSDSIIFNSNIEDFIGYDFIGAPWIKPTKKNQLFQGNGGFSLRNKQTMIDISTKYPITKIPQSWKPLQFMDHTHKNICPEDVYFNQYIIRNNNSKIPDFHTSTLFSIENIKSNELVFGGHNFFKHNWTDFFSFDYPISNITHNQGNFIFNNLQNALIKTHHSNELFILFNHKPYNHDKFLISKFTKNYSYKIKKNKTIKKSKTIHFHKILVFKKRFDHNWRHFLIETFFDLSYYTHDTMIVIPTSSPKWITEILHILNYNFYVVHDDTIVTFNHITQNYNDTTLQQQFLNLFINKCITLSHNMPSYNNIYLTRPNDNKNYRYIDNLSLLDNKLTHFHFIRGGTIPLHYQIYLIYKANNIITLIGANCDNVIFSNPNASFKIIFPFNCKIWARQYTKFKQVKLLYCGNKYYDNLQPDKYNWNYTIDFNVLTL